MYDGWAMRDYGVTRSWAKLYTFETRNEAIFHSRTRNGELLFAMFDPDLILWNLSAGTS